MRLIDADALKKHLDYVCVGGGKWGDAEKAFINAFKDFVDGEIAIEPQRKGEWLRYGEDGNPNTEDTAIWQCDHCLETYYGRTTRIPNYCPNCGADMRGEEEWEQ